MNVQSSGLSVQLPVGQSVAPRAKHLPAQLLPLPQETCLGVLLGVQHNAFVIFGPKLKALSYKSIDFEFSSLTVQFDGVISRSMRLFSDSRAFSI